HPPSTLFPSTTLFRSVANIGLVTALDSDARTVWAGTNNGLFRLNSNSDQWVREPKQPGDFWVRSVHVDRHGTLWVGSDRTLLKRSEEHTSELQSLRHL